MARLPFQFDVSSKYGAPMGRWSEKPAELCGRVQLRHVPMVGGGCYDQGGAYWGFGVPLWCAWNYRGVDGEMRVSYFRAPTREAAKALLPNCTFYR